MARMKFDDFLSDVDKKHQSLEIELADGDVVVFRNLLRLPKEKRAEIEGTFKKFQKDDDTGEVSEDAEVTQDEVEFFKDAMRLVASDPSIFEKFVNLVGDDAAAWLEVMNAWMKGTQAGEA